VKIVATGVPGGTSSTPFGLPFKFWDVPAGGIPTYGVVSTFPNDICGDQPACGTPGGADQIVRQDNANFAFRMSPACTWTGSLQTAGGMVPGRAYWYANRTGVARNFVLAGEVDNAGNYATISITNNSYTAYSWRDSRSVNRDDLNLVMSGFLGGATPTLSDQVAAQTGGAFFWRTSGGAWQGSLVTVEPGAAYWIVNRNHANGTWNYNYDASGNTLSIGDSPRNSDNTGTIGKASVTPVKSKSTSGSTRD